MLLLSTVPLLFFIMGQTVSAGGCNGNTALCSRQYSNVTQIGAHDSAFVGILPTDNQVKSVADQLDAGVRFLQAQTHENSGELHLCHTSCLELNAGPLTDYLSTIKTWMDKNKNEVVTLLLTNGDRVNVSTFGSAMSSTGLDKYAYVPPKKLSMDEWPTLQELIDDGKRLVMFLGRFLPPFYLLSNQFPNTQQITSQIPLKSITSSTSSATFSKRLTTSPILHPVLSTVHQDQREMDS